MQLIFPCKCVLHISRKDNIDYIYSSVLFPSYLFTITIRLHLRKTICPVFTRDKSEPDFGRKPYTEFASDLHTNHDEHPDSISHKVRCEIWGES